MPKSAKQLDREIAESYVGRPVTGYTIGSEQEPNRSRRVTGVVREVEERFIGNRDAGLVLWVELSNGKRLPVAYEWVEAVVPRAKASYRGPR